MWKELAWVIGGIILLLLIRSCVISNPVVQDMIETNRAIATQKATSAREASQPLDQTLFEHAIKLPEPVEDEPQEPIQERGWKSNEGS